MSISKRGPWRILVINPGSTSTKLAVFEDEKPVYSETIAHPHQQIAAFPRIPDQYAFRRDAVLAFLEKHGVPLASLDAVIGRGGLLHPLASGTYAVNERMLQELRAPNKERDHVVNLGALIANEIAQQAGIPAFIVDPVCVDEFEPLARVAGLPEVERKSLSHALSLKSAARRAARELGRSYESLNLVVVHMGGGISVSAHRQGRMIDVNQALDGTGPFSPERVGGLPVGDVMRLSFSGKYSSDELFRRFTRQGGLLAHLGTNDAIEVERRIAQGDEHARLIYEAMAYQIAKEIGLMSTVLKGQVDAIVLTGGLAYSPVLVPWIRERVEWIAPVLVYPGQDEMLAMAQGVQRLLDTDIGLAVTGIAGPSGGTPEKPVGTVFIAISSPSGDEVRRLLSTSDREGNKRFSAEAALRLLEENLRG
jgi:butyrate kinase